MGKTERSFQSYFMQKVKGKNYYRTALANGTGYPDITADHGKTHSFIELKDLVLGKKGDRKLRQCFQESQWPWYTKYLAQGGERLFIVMRVRDHDESNKRYGLWHMDRGAAVALSANVITYLDLEGDQYQEFKTLGELIEEIER